MTEKRDAAQTPWHRGVMIDHLLSIEAGATVIFKPCSLKERVGQTWWVMDMNKTLLRVAESCGGRRMRNLIRADRQGGTLLESPANVTRRYNRIARKIVERRALEAERWREKHMNTLPDWQPPSTIPVLAGAPL